MATLAQQQADLESMLLHLQTALDLKQGGVTGLAGHAKALLEMIQPFDPDGLPKANLFVARTHWLCHHFLMAYDPCIPYLDWAIATAKQTHYLWHDLEAYECIEAAYFMRSTIYSAYFDFESSLALVEQFKVDCVAARRGATQDLTDRIRLIKMRKLLHGGTQKEIRRGLKQMQDEIGQPVIVKGNLFVTVLHALEYLLSQGEFEATKHWLKLIAIDLRQMHRVESIVPAFLIELTIHYAAGSFTELENAIRRLIYFKETRGADASFIDLVVKGFRNLSKPSKAEKQALREFISGLDAHAREHAFERYSQIFDLRSYLVRHLMEHK